VAYRKRNDESSRVRNLQVRAMKNVMLKYINFALSFWLLSSLVGYFRKSVKKERAVLEPPRDARKPQGRIVPIIRAPQAVR
jgi:hypothetical protein